MTKRLLRDLLIQARNGLKKHPQHAHYMHWSFIIQGGHVIEWGLNRQGDPPIHFGYHHHSKLHSELVAYKKARGLLYPGPFDVVNIRLNRQGLTKLSTPCATCQSWLKAVGCRQMWFSLENDEWAKLI